MKGGPSRGPSSSPQGLLKKFADPNYGDREMLSKCLPFSRSSAWLSWSQELFLGFTRGREHVPFRNVRFSSVQSASCLHQRSRANRFMVCRDQVRCALYGKALADEHILPCWYRNDQSVCHHTSSQVASIK